MKLSERLKHFFEYKVIVPLAWRLPRTLVKWVAIRVVAHATQGPWNTQVVPELTAMDALKRWDHV